jgi:hypothetical protein
MAQEGGKKKKKKKKKRKRDERVGLGLQARGKNGEERVGPKTTRRKEGGPTSFKNLGFFKGGGFEFKTICI